MEITLNRDELLPALQVVAPAIETKQTLPVLSNVLWSLRGHQLTLLGTDLEIELTASLTVDQECGEFAITIPARKLLDIVRSLPEGATCRFRFTEKQCHLHSQDNRFVLATLPADNYPRLKAEATDIEFLIKQSDLYYLLHATAFAMAVQDIRYYLNGLYISLRAGKVTVIGTDGHRLAHAEIASKLHDGVPDTAFLLPRNAVMELLRLLNQEDLDAVLTITVGKGYCRLASRDFTFASKLIEGRVPDYQRAIPKRGTCCWALDRDALKSAVSRVSLVVNDKTKGVRLVNDEHSLQLHAYDAQLGEAQAQLKGDFTGGKVDVGLNAAYLLDVLNVLPATCKQIKLFFTGASGEEVGAASASAGGRVTQTNSSAFIEGDGVDDCFYVIMPMRV